MGNISNYRKANFREWLKTKRKLFDTTIDNYIRTLDKYNSDNYRIASTGQIFSQFQSISFSLFAIDDYSVIGKIIIAIGEDNSNNYEIKGAQGWRDDHRTLYNAIKQYVEFLQQGNHVNVTSEPENKQLAYNAVFFGAPGTGKSYKLNNIVKQRFGKRYERVTFYADYLHSQFVGAYKPVMVPGKDNRQIEYQFRPGPFTRVLVRALNDPSNNYALVIEELNRAEAASVFGDVFQLLDRDESGRSEYAITISEDLREYLEQVTEKEDCSQIFIPKNMYILATMNSADQGVFPLDTAFKRRWDFEYVGIDDGENAANENDERIRNWVTDYRKTINKKLLNAGIPEDKQMGPFFLGNPSLAYNDEDFNKAMKNKVIMYLFEDAAKYHFSDIFNANAIRNELDGASKEAKHFSLSDLFTAWDHINYGIFQGLERKSLDQQTRAGNTSTSNTDANQLSVDNQETAAGDQSEQESRE